MSEFPTQAGKRRVLIVLRGRDYEACELSKDGAKLLLDHETHVIDLEGCDGIDTPAMRHLRDRGQLSPGAVLIQSPFSTDEYLPVEHAALSLARLKHMLFSALCRHLGASEVLVNTVEARKRRLSQSGTVTVGGLTHRGDVSVDQTASDALKSQMHLHDVFDGGGADIPEAERFLRTFHLDHDTELSALVDMRRGSGNPLRERTLSISLSREAESQIQVAARLQIPNGIGIDANFKRFVDEVYDYTEQVTVKFP